MSFLNYITATLKALFVWGGLFELFNIVAAFQGMHVVWGGSFELFNIVAAFRGMHVSPAKHSYAWLPRKCDYRTDTRTERQKDRRQRKWSLCAAMLCRRQKKWHVQYRIQKEQTSSRPGFIYQLGTCINLLWWSVCYLHVLLRGCLGPGEVGPCPCLGLWIFCNTWKVNEKLYRIY